jgi:hypothetical protein
MGYPAATGREIVLTDAPRELAIKGVESYPSLQPQGRINTLGLGIGCRVSGSGFKF